MAAYDDTSIGIFDFHHSMLVDRIRVEAFMRAILATVQPGDVVVDIGTGTGILSAFAAIAGARQVYAIEREPIIDVAREIVERNGLSDRVTFLEGSSLDIELPERGDVLVSETIGNAAYDEGITRWYRDAKDRLLVDGAAVIPRQLDLEASLLTVPNDYEQIDRWSRPLMHLDLTPLRRVAVNNLLWAELSPAHQSSSVETVISCDLDDPPDALVGRVEFVASQAGTAHGLGVWFDAVLDDRTTISNRPPNVVPSWEQGFLPLAEPVAIQPGDRISATVAVDDDGATWSWSVADGPMQTTRAGALRRASQITDGA